MLRVSVGGEQDGSSLINRDSNSAIPRLRRPGELSIIKAQIYIYIYNTQEIFARKADRWA